MKRIIVASVAVLLSAGCKKSPSGGANEPLDAYGYTASSLQFVYTRPSGLRIDFPKTLNPEQSFTDAEIAVIVKAFDTLTDDELVHVQVVQPDDVPGSPTHIFYRPDLNLVHVVFSQPRTGRPLDANIGNKILASMGYSARAISPSSKVFNEATQEYLFPEVMPGLSQPLVVPKAAPLGSPLEVVSPNTPEVYTPLTSRAGHNALAAENSLVVKGNYKAITVDDVLRPHGNAQTLVVPRQ